MTQDLPAAVPWTALTSGSAAGAILIAIWFFLKAIGEQRAAFMAAIDAQRVAFMEQLKQQREECNADRALDRADRAQSRQEFTAALADMGKEIHKPWPPT